MSRKPTSGRGKKQSNSQSAAVKDEKKTTLTPSGVVSYDVNDNVTINAGDPNSIEQLRTMQKRGELPIEILGGTRDERERVFEEFARIYGDPPGILNEYTVKPVDEHLPNLLQITFTTDQAIIQGIRVDDVSLVKRGKDSELSRRGQINYAILKARRNAEGAASFRGAQGFPDISFAQKWGYRILSDAEKEQANQEIHAFLEKQFKSPVSKSGRAYVDNAWMRLGNGWVRKGSDMGQAEMYDRLRQEGYKFKNEDK